MKTKKRKWRASLLSVIMVLMMFPGMVYAEEGATANVSTKEEFVAAVNDTSVTVICVTANIDLTHPNGNEANVSDVLNVSGKTIDLGGYTVSADNFTLIFEGSNFVLQNGTFNANGGSYALFVGDEDETNHVLVQNITAAGGINVYNASNVTLRNVNVTGTQYYAVWCDENGKVTIESGSFQSSSTEANAVLGLTTSDSELTINGGDFTVSAGQSLVLSNEDQYGSPTISGGVYNIDPTEYVSENSTFISYTSNGGTVYALGSSIETVLANTESGDSIIVLQGSLALTDVPEGVTVENKSTGTVTVNDKEVEKDKTLNVTHSAVKTDAKAATCTEAGNIEYWYCKGCDKYFSDENCTTEIGKVTLVVAATGHTAVKTEAEAATCTTAGNIAYWYCSDCGKYFSDEALTQEITQANTVIAATGHKNVTKVEAKAVTCTTEGNIAYWYCSDCGKYFSDEALTQEITQADTVIAATGHNHVTKVDAKAATSTAAGNIAYWYCSDCGKYFSDEALTKEITKEATVVAATGTTTTSTTTTPQTGDNSNVALWFVLLAVSCGGLAGVLVYGRKRKCKH